MKLHYLKSVVTLQLDPLRCTGCGMCLAVCPRAVFEMRDHKAHLLHRDDCMECGACALNCKQKALTVRSGVGCAAGILNGLLNGTEPSCDCTKGSTKNCC